MEPTRYWLDQHATDEISRAELNELILFAFSPLKTAKCSIDVVENGRKGLSIDPHHAMRRKKTDNRAKKSHKSTAN